MLVAISAPPIGASSRPRAPRAARRARVVSASWGSGRGDRFGQGAGDLLASSPTSGTSVSVAEAARTAGSRPAAPQRHLKIDRLLAASGDRVEQRRGLSERRGV
jgi:hypothetical protein